MDKLNEELDAAMALQDSMRALADEIHSQNSLVLHFSLQWKDLECHFDSIRAGLLEHANKLALQETELVESRDRVRLKEMEIEGISRDVMEKKGELGLLQAKLEVYQTMVEDKEKELEGKEDELSCVQRRQDEIYKDISSKAAELGSLNKSIEEQCNQLKCKKREMEELGLKEEELLRTRSLVQHQEGKLHSVGRELECTTKSLQRCTEELKSNSKKLDFVNATLDAYVDNLTVKQAELCAVQASIDVGSENIREQEKLMERLQSQISKHSKELEQVKDQKLSMQRLVEELALGLQSEDKYIGVIGEQLSTFFQMLESRLAQLTSIQSKLVDCQTRLAAKEKHVDYIKNLLQKSVEELETRKRIHEKDVEQFKLKEAELEAKQKSLEELYDEVEEKLKQINNIKQPQTSAVVEGNGRNLQSLFNEHFKRHDLLMSEVWTTLLKSPDPAKLVLDGLFGFYPLEQENSGEYELGVIRKSCLTLLEFLSRISPTMEPQMLEESIVLARDWKSEVERAPGNTLEMLGLMKLISAFRLFPAFKACDLHFLLNAVNPNRNAGDKEAWKAVAFAESLVGSFILSPTVSVDQFGNPIHPSSEWIMPISISEESIWPQVLQDDPLPSPLSSDEVTTALGNSDDPAKMVFNEIKSSLMRYGKKRTEPCDESVPRYQVLLLQQLMSGSSVVSPRVKEEAKELAVTWRASLGQAALDSLAFLLFLAAYKLAPRFEEDDVLKLAENITHYTKAPELWSALGLKEKVPALIKRLVKRDMYMEAARFSCAFCLVDDYPPHLIVLKFLEKTCTLEKGRLLLESQSEAFNKHMDYLKQLIQRVQELNFDRNLVNWKLVEHFQDLARMLEREKSCILGVAAIIPQGQGGSKQYHYNEATDTSTIGQSSATAAHQYRTAFWEEEQKSTCQDGNLTHQGQINKRSKTDSQ